MALRQGTLRRPEDAVVLLREVGVMTLTPSKGVPSVVEAVVGEPVKGSWWGHPRGGAIYEAATGLSAHPDVLTTKLVEGRVSFVHRDLWAALLRVVTDADWRERRARSLGRAAAAVLQRVEEEGKVTLEDLGLAPDVRRSAKKQLEGTLLVLSEQEHTERGHHATVMRSWQDWAQAPLRRAAAKLTLEEALATLERAAPAARRALEDR